MRGYQKIFDNTGKRFIKWFIGAEKSPMFQGKNKEAYIKLFQTLLISASWQDTSYEQNGRSFTVKKGEVITKYEYLAKASNLTRSQVRGALDKFNKYGAIVNHKGIPGVGKVIYIVNYKEYQEKYIEHPKKHYYCPEASTLETEKQQKFTKTAEVLEPNNKLEILIEKLKNDPSLVNKLLLILDFDENKNSRSLAEEQQKFSRSLAEVSSCDIYNARVTIKEDKKNNRLKEKESKKKKITNLLFQKEAEVKQEQNAEVETLKKDIPQNIIKAFLVATGKIQKDDEVETSKPLKVAVRDEARDEIITFFENNNTLTEEQIEYLFKRAYEDILLKAKPENRGREYTIGYLFKRLSETTFFNDTMTNYQKEQEAIMNNKPKEEIECSMQITEETEELNKKFHKKLKYETRILGSFFYELNFKNKIFIGGYDTEKRILRVHFESFKTYQTFTIHTDYQRFLLNLLNLSSYGICENETKNMVMLPVFDVEKIIHWEFLVQGDLFSKYKTEEEKKKHKLEFEAEETNKLSKKGFIPREKTTSFGFKNKTIGKNNQKVEMFYTKMVA